MSEITIEDVFKGQEKLDHFKRTIPDLWKQQNNAISKMWHMFFWDGTSEIIMIPLGDFEEQEGKDLEASFIADYCQERKPSAIAQITEAWAWKPPKGFKIDMEKLYNDPGYYQEYKNQCIREEVLIVNIETVIGVVSYAWNIDRSGDEPKLINFVEMANRHSERQGRFDGFLKPIPQNFN